MAVFESRTPWRTRRDVKVDDIAPNIRYVHITGIHSITLTLSFSEKREFMEWCIESGIRISSTVERLKSELVQFVLPLLTENQVMLIKLAWSRYDIVD